DLLDHLVLGPVDHHDRLGPRTVIGDGQELAVGAEGDAEGLVPQLRLRAGGAYEPALGRDAGAAALRARGVVPRVDRGSGPRGRGRNDKLHVRRAVGQGHTAELVGNGHLDGVGRVRVPDVGVTAQDLELAVLAGVLDDAVGLEAVAPVDPGVEILLGGAG